MSSSSSSPSPIPILLCGKSPTLATTFSTALSTISSDYEIVHVIHSVSAGLRELPILLRGGQVTDPDTDIACKHITPQAIVVGKGYDDDEVAELRKVEGAGKLPWLLADDQKMTWTRIAKVVVSAGTGLPVVVAQRVVECMQEHGIVPGKEWKVEEGTVWGF